MKFNAALSVVGTILLSIAGSLCQLDECGRVRLNSRIIGGENATAGSWPWQVSIHLIDSGHYCGGTLITKDWVLSAAHCFEGLNASDILMYFGRLNQSGSNPHEISRTASQIIIHPKFDYSNADNNIALIQLNSSVTFSDYIKPVCLAANGSVFDAGTESWITGWGSLKLEVFQFSDTLQEVMIPIVNNSDCAEAYGGYNISVTDNMICAGLLNQGGKGACYGDSGGPMVSKKDSLWIQSGIVSITWFNCEQPSVYPSVNTRVSQYQNWIKNYTNSNPPGFVEFNTDIQQSTPTPTPTSTSTPTPTPTSTSTSTSTPTSTPTSTSKPTSTSTPGPASNSNSRSAPSLLLFSLSLTFSFIPFIFSLFLAGFED